MYGVRWSVHYQHFFERKGWERMTSHFGKWELEEWGQDPTRRSRFMVAVHVFSLPLTSVGWNLLFWIDFLRF
jgi:hypothetical protein